MKVSELMERLNQFSPDAEVYTILPNDNPIGDGCEIGNIYAVVEHDEAAGVYIENK